MLKKFLVAAMMVVTLAGAGVAAAPTAFAAKCTAPDTLFAIPAWYKGLQKDDFSIKTIGNPTAGNTDTVKIETFITRLALNIIQALMVIVAYVTIFFIIKGGFGYMTSAGSSDGMASARKTITNAVIGLVIAILAASIVNAVAGVIN